MEEHGEEQERGEGGEGRALGERGEPGELRARGELGEPGDLRERGELRARGELGERERGILALERQGFSGPGAKERVIRERLGLAPVRYYQLLNALLDDPRALAHDPVTVNRLRRIRESRRAGR